MKWRNKSLSYWFRVLHRDLGYLMVGVCLIYAVSGILLNHMNGKDPAFRTTEAAVQLEKGMQGRRTPCGMEPTGRFASCKAGAVY